MSPRTIATLERLVGFDTTSRNSNLPLIAWVEEELARFGVPSFRVYDETGEKANLFATIGPADVPGYILSGHTDVVPVDGQEWLSDPFTLVRRGSRLFGRGTSDMKGFVACCIAKLPELTAQPLKTPIHFSFSYDEEVGCLGVPGLVAELAGRPVIPAGCFVGEPTSMQVVVSHKTKRSFNVRVQGRSCHSSLAPEGVNAVEYAARLIVFIRELGVKLRDEGPRDGLFDVPFTTAHTGTIQGGTVLNIVPDHCEFSYEFRVLPREDVDALSDAVEAYAREELEPEMKAIAPEAGFTFEAVTGFPGLDTEVEAPVTLLAKRLAGRNDHAKVAYGTEAGIFESGGIPTVVVGPGSIEQAHKPDEFIEISELERCEAFIDRLIAHCAA